MKCLNTPSLFLALFVAVAFSMTYVPAIAEESDLPDELEGYALTGETENCLRSSRIRDSRPLDDHHILFEMRNGDSYLNRLSDGCNGIASNVFVFDSAAGRVCENQIIKVVDETHFIARGACGLGEFEKLEEAES